MSIETMVDVLLAPWKGDVTLSWSAIILSCHVCLIFVDQTYNLVPQLVGNLLVALKNSFYRYLRTLIQICYAKVWVYAIKRKQHLPETCSVQGLLSFYTGSLLNCVMKSLQNHPEITNLSICIIL